MKVLKWVLVTYYSIFNPYPYLLLPTKVKRVCEPLNFLD